MKNLPKAKCSNNNSLVLVLIIVNTAALYTGVKRIIFTVVIFTREIIPLLNSTLLVIKIVKIIICSKIIIIRTINPAICPVEPKD